MVWIVTGQLGIHSHLLSEGESVEGTPYNITCDEDEFQLSKVTSKSLELSHTKADKLLFKIILPERVFKNIHSKNVGLHLEFELYYK